MKAVVTLFIVALSTFAAVVAVAGGFVAICGAIGAGIAAVNATTNVATSFRAANTACNGDPTWARIYSKQNTLSEVIRETNFNNGTLNGLSYLGADVIDATEMFCDIVAIVEIGRNLPKLFAKKNFNIFKKGSFRLEDFKTGIKNSFADIKVGIKKGFTDFQANVKEGYTYFKTNIKNGFFGKVDNVVVDDILTKGGLNTKFKYKHNPSDNPKVLQDAWEDTNAVYGYSPNPESESIGGYSNNLKKGYDWSDPQKVEVYQKRRLNYHNNNDNIDELIIRMKKEGASSEEIGRAANYQRNDNRINDYINNNDLLGLENVKRRNLTKYGDEFGLTAEGALKKYGSWEKVIEKSKSANPGMDASCGLYDKYYHLYEIDQ